MQQSPDDSDIDDDDTVRSGGPQARRIPSFLDPDRPMDPVRMSETGSLAAGIIGGAAASFFLTTDFWSGAIAEAMGYIDLSAPVAMIVSGGLYYLFTRRGHTFGDAR